MIPFLRLCGFQNTDHVTRFLLLRGAPKFSGQGKMSTVQGSNFEGCKMHRMKREMFEFITYNEFACSVLKTIGAFLEGKSPRDVRIQYRDDDREDTFVNLSCDDDLIDGYRCLRPVDNCENLYRLSVRVHATATPVQVVHARTEKTIVNEPAKRRSVSPPPRKQLHFTENTTTETTRYRSPLQVFLQEKQKAVTGQPKATSIPITRGTQREKYRKTLQMQFSIFSYRFMVF